MKEFLEEPKGTTYKELLNVAFSICDQLLLVKTVKNLLER